MSSLLRNLNTAVHTAAVFLVLLGSEVFLYGRFPGRAAAAQSSPEVVSSCPAPALSRFSTHTVAAGETLDAIAKQYNLLPTTLMAFNSGLSDGLRPGQTLTIPPFNGRVVQPAPNQTWQEVAATYDSRADVLFEINGCQGTVPERIFVPGVFWQSQTATNQPPVEHPLSQLPLLERPVVVQAYGWQPDPSQQELVFHTGVTLQGPARAEVLAAGPGTVAFVGPDQVNGQLVVINHAQGLQTRYANLEQLQVQVGDRVQAGDALGVLGAEMEKSFLYFEVRMNSAQGWVAQNPGDYLPDLALR